MKKITILFLALLAFCLQSNAQFTFPTDAGPYVVVGQVPTDVNYNDAGNSAGVPSGTYISFTVTVDWSVAAPDPWSSEADLTVTTANDVVVVDPPSSGGASSGAATTLTFSGALPNGYDPDVDGSLDLTFNQSFGPSESNWANISITLIPAPTCTTTVVDSSTVVDDCVGGTYTVDLVVSLVGDGDVITDGTNNYTIVAGTVTAGPYPIESGVVLDVVHTDSACDFSLGVFNSACPAANDLCADAVTVVCGDTVSGNNLTATDGDGVADDGCGTSATAVGVWYTYMGTGDTVTASTCATASFDTEITVYTGDCGALVCLDNNDDSAGCGLTSQIEFQTLVGTQYNIYVSGFGPATGNFDLSITCVPPPACTQAVIDSSTIVESCNPDGTGTFTIDHVVSNAGDAGTILDDGITTYAVTVGTVTTGPYNIGDSITIELTGTDPACDFTVGTFEFTCPPANDEIAGAINLPVGDTVCETLVSGTNIGATDSIENVNEAVCSASDPAGDVWFQVTVPSTGELTIETSASAVTPVITDTVMIVYSGTSGALVEIECDDDDGAGLLSLVALTGLTPGDVLLVRVWEWQNDFAGNFNICAWSPTTLGVEDNTFDGFNYFPNPVKDVLTLESPITIDAIEVLNILGQRIMTIESQNTTQNIDMSHIQSGAYFVKVSIGNQIKTIRILKD